MAHPPEQPAPMIMIVLIAAVVAVLAVVAVVAVVAVRAVVAVLVAVAVLVTAASTDHVLVASCSLAGLRHA